MEKGVEVAHYMKVDAAVLVLISEHSEMKAHQRALREQQNARRARSRKRSEFWVAVASRINAQQTPAYGQAGQAQSRPAIEAIS